MKRFATTTKLIEAYTTDHNSRCCPDKHFTPAEIERHFLTTMTRHALKIKHGVNISDKQASVIPGFGYVDADGEAQPAFTFTREIRYSRHTHDYDMYLDGEYRGSRASYRQAEVDLDTLVSDLLHSGICRAARSLDAEPASDKIAADVAEHAPRIDPEISEYSDTLAFLCESCGDWFSEHDAPTADDDASLCAACRESGEAVIDMDTPLTDAQLVVVEREYERGCAEMAAHAVAPAAPAPEEQTNYGGWRISDQQAVILEDIQEDGYADGFTFADIAQPGSVRARELDFLIQRGLFTSLGPSGPAGQWRYRFDTSTYAAYQDWMRRRCHYPELEAEPGPNTPDPDDVLDPRDELAIGG